MHLFVPESLQDLCLPFICLHPGPYRLPHPTFETWKTTGSADLKGWGLERMDEKCSAGLWWVGVGADGSSEPLFLQLLPPKQEWASPLDPHSFPVLAMFSVCCCLKSQEIVTRAVIKHLRRRFWELVSRSPFTQNGILNSRTEMKTHSRRALHYRSDKWMRKQKADVSNMF